MSATGVSVYRDEKGNTHIRGKPYKSRNTALLFDPLVMQKTKTSFGKQFVQGNQNWLWNKSKIAYHAKRQSDGILKSVNNFLTSYKDQGKRLQVFKNALQSRIYSAKQNTSTYNIQQLSQFFPWMMSCNLLFDPLRIYLYSIYVGLKPNDIQQWRKQIPQQMINSTVNSAIYNCVINNGSLLQNAKSLFQQKNIGYLIKGYRLAMQKSQQFKRVVESIKDNAKKIGNNIYDNFVPTIVKDAFSYAGNAYGRLAGFFSRQKTGGDGFADLIKQKQQKMKEDPELYGTLKFFDELADQITKQLRVYGEIVINFTYIRYAAQRIFVEGRSLYYFLDRPNLLFSIQNSYPSVYSMDQNNLITKIPPGEFNLVYLRKLLGGQVVGLGGRMLKSIKDDISKTDDEVQPLKRFQNRYLNWKQEVTSVDADQYDQINEHKLFNKQKMGGSDYQRFLEAYETDTPAIVNNGNIYIKKSKIKRNREFLDQQGGQEGYNSEVIQPLPKKKMINKNWNSGNGLLNKRFKKRPIDEIQITQDGNNLNQSEMLRMYANQRKQMLTKQRQIMQEAQ